MFVIRTVSEIFSAALDTIEAFPMAFVAVGGIAGIVAIVVAVAV